MLKIEVFERMNFAFVFSFSKMKRKVDRNWWKLCWKQLTQVKKKNCMPNDVKVKTNAVSAPKRSNSSCAQKMNFFFFRRPKFWQKFKKYLTLKKNSNKKNTTGSAVLRFWAPHKLPPPPWKHIFLQDFFAFAFRQKIIENNVRKDPKNFFIFCPFFPAPPFWSLPTLPWTRHCLKV